MYVQNILLWTYEDIANSFHIKKKQYFFINRTQNHTFFTKKASDRERSLATICVLKPIDINRGL